MTSPQVLVLDCHVHTLTVVRSLARAGYEIILGVTEQDLHNGFVHHSNVISSIWRHPDILERSADFETALRAYLSGNPQLKAVFPVGENSVRCIAQMQTELPGGVVVAMPDKAAITACFDKPQANRIAAKLGIPVPQTTSACSAAELRAAIEKLGFPAIVKAPDSTSLLLGKKCVFIRNRHDLDTVAGQWPQTQNDYVVQSEIAGPRFNCDIVAANGRIRQFFESKIWRTDQHDYAGNSVFDRSIAPTDARLQYCAKYLAEINYTGVALIQFLQDAATGESFFIEANPRAGSTIGLAVNCGIDLPAESLAAHLGFPGKPRLTYPIGRSQNWLHGDLLGLRKSMQDRSIGTGAAVLWLSRALVDFVRADHHTTFIWSDPRPTLRLYRKLFLRMFRDTTTTAAHKCQI